MRRSIFSGSAAPIFESHVTSLLRLHPEAQLVAVQVQEVKVSHAIRIVPRLGQRSGAARSQFLVQRIHVGDEDIDGATARLALRLTRRLEMDDHPSRSTPA